MSDLPSHLGFAPGTIAVWTALLAGIATILAYLRPLQLAPQGAVYSPARGAARGGGANPAPPGSLDGPRPACGGPGLRVAVGAVRLRHRGPLAKEVGRLGGPRDAVGPLPVPAPRRRHSDGGLLGLQGPRL